MARTQFVTDAEDDGVTLAAALRRHLAAAWGDAPVAWSRVRRLCESGKVNLDGARTLDSALRVKPGQAVEVDEARPAPDPAGDAARAALVWEDTHVVIINKPAGIQSVPYERDDKDTAMDVIRAAWRRAGRRATEQPLFVVHRIDKETSGLLAFAKSKLSERGLAAQFRAHEVERTYQCVAHGQVESRRIESYFLEDRGDGLRGSARQPHMAQGKRAVTHVRALELLPRATVCEVKLETGKTHQIRIHLSEAGHPLVGERVYIRDYASRGGELLPAPRLLLHAATLGFVHPVTEEALKFEAPLPPDYLDALDKLR